jgi:hypothetical protein
MAYCVNTDVYSKTGLSTSEVASALVDAYILEATAELESLAGRSFANGNSVTEYIGFRDKDITGLYQNNLQLSHYPIQSISLFTKLDSDGTATTTYANLTSVQITAGTISTVDYWLNTSNDSLTNSILPNGQIMMKTDTFPASTHGAKVTYTYGYATVPKLIESVTSCLAGIRTWLHFIGASYNRLNSYSIPQQTVQKGDFYQRGMQNINLLTEEANRLLDRIGRAPRTFILATGGNR